MDKKTFKRLLQYLKPYWKRLIFAFICMIGVGGLSGLAAYLIKPALDGVFISKNKQMLMLLPIAIMLTYFFKGMFTYLQGYQTHYIAEKVLFNIRNQLFEHIVYLPTNFFDKYHTGEIMSRILNDTEQVQNSIANVIPNTIREIFTIVGLVVVLYVNNYKLAFISTVVFPLAAYPVIHFGKKMKKIGKRRQLSIANITMIIQETLTNIRLIKAFATEKKEANEFLDESDRFLNIKLEAIRIDEATSPLMEFIGSVGIGVLIWVGGYIVFKDMLSVGGFFSFMAALFMLYKPFKTVAKANNEINTSIASVERIFEIIDTEKEKYSGSIRFEGVKDSIKFENVYFSYSGDDKYALKDINLTIPAKSVVALVGESGGGKSTILELIPRFYEPTRGRITIDGIDLRELDLVTLRRKIAIVSQRIMLFNRSVKENIAYGREDLTDEEIIKAAKDAYAHDFIMKLKDGYDTNLGEQGVILSGGERQRIAIARAIVKDPDILILDEATSALDLESEQIVQKALNNLMKNRTVIMAAHRISTAMIADKIVVMKSGKILAQGKHKELLEKCEYYRKLYNLQANGDADIV
ncbi:ABC transporter ATP-binding protein [Hippea maritima]|uniref:Xenobiotic-transporting ATPase n=1 Tax=Hippea maritima (strain ATCC 700847 / DSM 10411 / MH2) TaxID=760142 RepID=F2LXE3_HIPMA|nr:ABC transporter ATP-binding protein [Hippea maritima]AEA34257.1 Xenobiotic-transporting ATPase [Hippea maritima DSM 10411]